MELSQLSGIQTIPELSLSPTLCDGGTDWIAQTRVDRSKLILCNSAAAIVVSFLLNGHWATCSAEERERERHTQLYIGLS